MPALSGGDEIDIEAVIPPTSCQIITHKLKADNSLALNTTQSTTYTHAYNRQQFGINSESSNGIHKN